MIDDVVGHADQRRHRHAPFELPADVRPRSSRRKMISDWSALPVISAPHDGPTVFVPISSTSIADRLGVGVGDLLALGDVLDASACTRTIRVSVRRRVTILDLGAVLLVEVGRARAVASIDGQLLGGDLPHRAALEVDRRGSGPRTASETMLTTTSGGRDDQHRPPELREVDVVPTPVDADGSSSSLVISRPRGRRVAPTVDPSVRRRAGIGRRPARRMSSVGMPNSAGRDAKVATCRQDAHRRAG